MRTRRLEPRDNFAAILAQFHAANADIYNMSKPDHPERVAILKDYRDRLFAKAREVHPTARAKWYACSAIDNIGKYEDPAVKIIGKEAWDEIIKSFEPRITAYQKAAYAKRDALKKQVDDLADKLTPEPGDKWFVYMSSDEHSYRTQTNPLAYAEGRAKVSAITLAMFCPTIPVFVRYVEATSSDRYSYSRWETRVRLKSKLDFHILKHGGPSYTLRDWCLICWIVGINPRVLNSFLPHGIEGDYSWFSPAMVAMREKVAPIEAKLAEWSKVGWNESLCEDK